MRYIVIGLGNYGHVLAEELSALGNEVIGVDSDPNKVDTIKDKVTTAFVIDATDEHSLDVLPLENVDVVIVAIGSNFGASVRAVALLKQKKVGQIYARAIDGVHRSVLEAFGLTRILTPEYDAAQNLVQLLDFGTAVEAFRVDADYYVVKCPIPKRLVGFKLNELGLDKEFNLKLIGLIRHEKITNCLGIGLMEEHVNNSLPVDEVILEHDRLVCYARYRDFQSFWKAF